MKIINKFMYAIHRILGTLLGILFLVWFLSAFVMMYHGFPRVGQQDRMDRLECLSDDPQSGCLPSIDSVLARLPQEETVKSVSMERSMGQAIFKIRTSDSSYTLPADADETVPDVDGAFIRKTAVWWCDAPIVRIDTMRQLDQWIPFGRLKKVFPIYKFHFGDKEAHQLYISSQSGEVLQFTDRSERFWAWLGAIPHWVYFTWLRQDAELWSKTVIWLSGIGCIMVIAGIWVAVDVWRKTRRSKRGGFSPYRKKWYHWHYVTGILFGIFVLTFVFSGMMSLAEIPEWISKPVLSVNPMQAFGNPKPKAEEYSLDYRQLVTAYPNAKQIEWSNFCQHPYYIVKGSGFEEYVDATDTVPGNLHLSDTEIRKAVESIYKTDNRTAVPLHMTLMEDYDTYYRDMSRMYPNRSLLPVWKVVAEDEDNSVYYIHPETGIVLGVNYLKRKCKHKVKHKD